MSYPPIQQMGLMGPPAQFPSSSGFYPQMQPYPAYPMPPQQGFPMPVQPQMNQSLRPQLQSGRVFLNDMYFGDDGANRLAKDIKSNDCSQVQIIEIRGNNISATGFENLFKAFIDQMESLKAISIEWNHIGSHPKGLQALEDLLMKRDTITFVDLRNNKIGGPEQCETIARIIRSVKNLKTLDLRWNELGNSCAQTILNALKSNNTLLSLELSGNSINNDVLKKIYDILQRNRENRQSKTMKSGQKPSQTNGFDPIYEQDESDFNDRSSYPQQEELPQMNMRLVGDSPSKKGDVMQKSQQYQRNALNETKHAINNLDQALAHEKKLGQETRARLENEVEGLKNQDFHRLSQLKSVEQQLQVVLQQNQFLKLELDRANKELETIQNTKGQQLETYESKLQQHQQELDGQEAKHKRNIERLLREQETIVEGVHREDGAKISRLEQHLQQLEQTNEQLLQEIKQAEEQSVKEKLEHEEQLRNVTEKVTQEEFRRYQNQLRVMETRLEQLEQQRIKSLQKTSETINDAKRKEEMMSADLLKAKDELKEFEIENKDLQHRNNEYTLLVEKFKHEIELKENIVDKLQNEINTLNDIIEAKKEENKNQMGALRKQSEKEISDYEQTKEASKHKITELETLLRDTHNENLRLRQDYNRLSSLLQTAVSKQIFQTFTDNHYF